MPEEVSNSEEISKPEEVSNVEKEVSTSEEASNVETEVSNTEEPSNVETEVSSTEETSNVETETSNTEEVSNSEEPSNVEEEEVSKSEEVVVKAKKESSDGKKWFSLRVISGKERKIKERIELEVQRSGWKDYVCQVLVPTEKVYKIRNGKKMISERNILPGYILVEAVHAKFSGEMITAIANIPNVIHFLGRNNPIPMQESEANRMLGKVDASQDIGEALIEPYIVGETVKIIDGPFNEFVGDIQEVNEEKKKLKVIVKIFGRGTEVELNFMQVEKQS